MKIDTISPIDNSIVASIEPHRPKDIKNVLNQAEKAKIEWSRLSVKDRSHYIRNLVEIIVAEKEAISKEITWQMGRPISQSPGEINGFAERANHMIDIAEDSLKPHIITGTEGYERWIDREPLGLIVVLSPWNYPFLTSVNAIVPALMAGNVVVLKHSFQTPLVAERYVEAARKAGLPEGVFQILHLSHEHTSMLVKDQSVDGVCFTGSVKGGIAIQQALTHKFIPCGLELGGKDPAYVRADMDLNRAIENLVDGSFFNSGQSCCGIERIYVDKAIYPIFLEGFVELTKKFKLGNPLEEGVDLGPMVKTEAASFVRRQIKDALSMGAKSLVDESLFKASRDNSPYLSPHVLVDVNHNMKVMRDESFGPVVGIMPVDNDEQAIKLMNDSPYGLTASIWTENMSAAKRIGSSIATGTVFMNRCDYLDPALAWTGVKNSGRGISLSKLGYDHVTRVKSYHFRK